jgi:hypothetical protein
MVADHRFAGQVYAMCLAIAEKFKLQTRPVIVLSYVSDSPGARERANDLVLPAYAENLAILGDQYRVA